MNDLIITNQGSELIAKMLAGTSTATFTKIQTSSYAYKTNQLENLTFLDEVRQESLVSNVSLKSDATVEVLAAISNTELTEGYYVKTLGLFAKDSAGSEILYAIAIDNDNPDYVPAFDGKNVCSITFRLNTKVDRAEQVIIEVSPAAVPTMEQVQELRILVEKNNRIIMSMLDPSLVDKAFFNVFSYLEEPEPEDEESMTSEEVEEAIDTIWHGESSTDPTAMNSQQVFAAINTEWDGSSSRDPTALNREEISEALEEGEKQAKK